MEGRIISLDAVKKQGQVEQNLSKRIFPFSYDAWEEKEIELSVGLDVEFSVESRFIRKMRAKIIQPDLESIIVTKPMDECINEFFQREIDILKEHSEFVDGHPEIDFIRMRRFLFTAYNDLCHLDNMLENKELKHTKTEVIMIYRSYDEFSKKMQYPLAYCFHKIFLSRQVEYTKLEQQIEDIKLGMANAKFECEPLSKKLEEQERNLKLIVDNKSNEYIELEKEVKALRRRLVDLIDYVAKQRDIVARDTERLKIFRESNLEAFSNVFTPMTEEIKQRFIKLLNTKGYDLDKNLWARAKINQFVKKFFRDADIHGGYNSKTYLRYFLKGIDKSKVTSPQTKELFSLLKTLESNSKQNVMVIQESDTTSFKSQQLIERVDSTLKVIIENNPFNALNVLIANPQDIVILDWKNTGLLAFDFIREFREISPNKIPHFIVVTPNPLEYDVMEEGRNIGVEYYVNANDAEGLSDAIRMSI